MLRMLLVVSIAALMCTTAAAEESFEVPQGALLCKTIELAIEHSKVVRAPSSAGIRPFVEKHTASGDCVASTAANASAVVKDVDQRGFALVEAGKGGPMWTDAENVWGYFEAPAKIKAWTKP